ncbi:hypothetical protein [Shewanella insulae]|uniref:hypothetical protein n=1 Tax=Shewanella insulae TaxID=2681496 RepID=UPI0024810F7F|nr:hypothetical protein [Shewanella insulae]
MNDWRKKGSNQKNPLAFGIGIGVAIGSGVGVALGNLALGIGVGIAIGAALTYQQKKEQNNETEE